MADFYIKKNDRLPEFIADLLDADGNPVDLTSAISVAFHMKAKGAATAKVNAAAEFVSRPIGRVKYVWVAADTDTAKVYQAEFEVTWAIGTETFPNKGHLVVAVVDSLA